MRPEDLVFWLDVLGAESETSGGVLCVRHADSMVVPRHWMRGGRPVQDAPATTAPAPVVDDVPWMPNFDDSNDLGGLLAARSPLLARAFRGDDRPRPR
jgi:hypothetical protein